MHIYTYGDKVGKYNRNAVYKYAKKWAFGRNTKYYNYDPVGGDCTNFVSQCIFAGCKQMNYNKTNGKEVSTYLYSKYRCVQIE